MNDSPLQLTLREMRLRLGTRQALAVLSVVALTLGLSGPFGTFGVLPIGPRLAYWAVIVFVTFAVGNFFGALADFHLAARVPGAARMLLDGIAAGVPVTAAVLGVNALAFPGEGSEVVGALPLLGYCVVVSIGVTAIFRFFRQQETGPEAPPPILERLPLALRGPLVRLSMQDHYVEVETARGKALLLLRLADAIRETGDVPGLQIHRSHWVAVDAVKAVRRQGDRALVETTTGLSLPVSRTYLPKLREMGLLPRR